MIVVLADDLTGAAEIGGICLRYGLKVKIIDQLRTISAGMADVVVIHTRTRSMVLKDAMIRITAILQTVKQLPYTHLFKKIDSVLRGHVVPEIHKQLALFDGQQALILPANPALGRTIKQGNYYMQGTLIHQTDFCNDPEFPINDSSVYRMLGADASVVVATWGQSFPSERIVVGEAASEIDTVMWVKKKPAPVLLAGAAEAFHAFLQYIVGMKPPPDISWSDRHAPSMVKPSLYVCGSKFAGSTQRIRTWEKEQEPVYRLPIQKMEQTAFRHWLDNWKHAPIHALSTFGKAIVAFDDEHGETDIEAAVQLGARMAQAICTIKAHTTVAALVIEGGATAGAILQQLHGPVLIPIEELAPGIIRCQTDDESKLWITLKPGSYNWDVGLA